MKKLVVGTFLTLDGVMQAPGGPDEDRDGGFELGGWSMSYWDEMMGKVMTEYMAAGTDLLLGRRTYEIFAGYWPQVTDPNDAGAAKLNSIRKHIASRTLKKADWNNSTVIRGDVAEYVRKLKEEGSGEIQVTGSCNLIQTLLEHDLVDELVLWLFPVAVGPGKRLFDEGTVPRAFRLTTHQVSSTGVAIHHYERVGAIKTGSAAVEDGKEVVRA